MAEPRLTVAELALDPLMVTLLYSNGASDRKNGVSMRDGWAEVCKEFGWSPYNRTPARERYEDGYYSA